MADRISQFTAELLAAGVPAVHNGQITAEVFVADVPALRVAQLITETLCDDRPGARGAQLLVEMLYAFVTARVAQSASEVLVDDDPPARSAQLALEILHEYPQPPYASFTMSNLIFPSLPGLSWDVKKTPQFGTTIVKHPSGRETRVANYSHPLWKWEMSYEILRETQGYQELQALCGFFLARTGAFDTFLFADPSEPNTLTDYEIGVGDGFTNQFTLTKSYGGFIEPVGYADPSSLQVFVGGVAVLSPASWNFVSPNTLVFLNAPAAGIPITATYTWYYRVRFGEDAQDYNNFMYQLWDLKKLTLEMVKP